MAQREEIAEKSAVAAVKYSLLRVSLPSDVAFDVNASVSFDGDSGPYLLYTYARCKSVLQKSSVVSRSPRWSSGEAGQSSDSLKTDTCLPARQGWKLNAEEHLIARLIHFYPQIVSDAAATFAPSMLCKYLFELASSFNSFYAMYKIGDSSYRLALTSAVAQVLKNGLNILGIETVERM